MNRSRTLVGIAIVAAVAIAVPAFAGGLTEHSTTAQQLSLKRVQKNARKLSHKALRIAREALARTTQPGSQGPVGPAGGAGAAGPPGAAGNAPGFGSNPGPVTATDPDNYAPDAGGPSVTVNVPQASNGPNGVGFIQVAAQATVDDDGAAVGLFEDGGLMPNQGDTCEDTVAGNLITPLFVSLDGFPDGTWGTPAQLGSFGEQCASANSAGPVVMETTPGSHTYSLEYAPCACTVDTTTLTDIKLWVTPLN